MSRLHFDLKKPCKGCPFLRDAEDVAPVRLRAGRIEQVWRSTEHHGPTFQCHNTVDYDRSELHGDDEDEIRIESKGRAQMCAGAIVSGIASGAGPVHVARVAAQFGMCDLDALSKQVDRCFASVDEMLETAV